MPQNPLTDCHMNLKHPSSSPLIRIAFVYNGPKGMDTPNPRYSGGSYGTKLNYRGCVSAVYDKNLILTLHNQCDNS